MRKYKHLDTLPIGRASDEITEGCLVLEGGAGIGNRSVSVKTGRDKWNTVHGWRMLDESALSLGRGGRTEKDCGREDEGEGVPQKGEHTGDSQADV